CSVSEERVSATRPSSTPRSPSSPSSVDQVETLPPPFAKERGPREPRPRRQPPSSPVAAAPGCSLRSRSVPLTREPPPSRCWWAHSVTTHTPRHGPEAAGPTSRLPFLL